MRHKDQEIPSLRGLWPLGLCLLFGCQSFSRTLREFDSVTGRARGGAEPDTVVYSDSPERLPWYVRGLEGSGMDLLIIGAFSIAPSPMAESNPSGFAREKMLELTDMVGNDLFRAAQVVARLLWVAGTDSNSLNKVVALKGAERIMAQLGLDPLDRQAHRPVESDELRQAVKASIEVLNRLHPGRDRPAILAPAERQAYSAALEVLVRSPAPRAMEQRKRILELAARWIIEPDPALQPALERALRRAIHYGICTRLRLALEDPDSELRDEAMRAYCRLGGPEAVAFLLDEIVWENLEAKGVADDQLVSVRRTLVRLCAQLCYERACKRVGRGRRPIEILYLVAANEKEEDGLRQLALEGLARCLGERRILRDLDWAKQWWKNFVIDLDKTGEAMPGGLGGGA